LRVSFSPRQRGATPPVDVRIISATHVDMQTAMIEGRSYAMAE
jgi:DNA-binding NtrC family response regulator